MFEETDSGGSAVALQWLLDLPCREGRVETGHVIFDLEATEGSVFINSFSCGCVWTLKAPEHPDSWSDRQTDGGAARHIPAA